MDFYFHKFIQLFSEPTSTFNIHKTLHQWISELSYLWYEKVFACDCFQFCHGFALLNTLPSSPSLGVTANALVPFVPHITLDCINLCHSAHLFCRLKILTLVNSTFPCCSSLFLFSNYYILIYKLYFIHTCTKHSGCRHSIELYSAIMMTSSSLFLS